MRWFEGLNTAKQILVKAFKVILQYFVPCLLVSLNVKWKDGALGSPCIGDLRCLPTYLFPYIFSANAVRLFFQTSFPFTVSRGVFINSFPPWKDFICTGAWTGLISKAISLFSVLFCFCFQIHSSSLAKCRVSNNGIISLQSLLEYHILQWLG